MTTLITILVAVLIWCIQALLAVVINIIGEPTRIPTSGKDFMMLTFAPYVIFCKLFKPDRLQ